MGAESSVLQDCEIGEVIEHPGGVNWELHDAISNEGEAVSVFVYKKKEKRELDLLKLNSQHLKTLRHPNILHYVASGQSDDGSYLLTERVVPLDTVLSSLTFDEIIAGLHDLLDALIFLHDTVKVCHNNINLSALYITKDSRWRLGGFEHACFFKDATREFLDLHRAYRIENSVAPEEKESSYKPNPEHGYCRDVFAFGVFADYILEVLGEVSTGDLTKTFELMIQDECLNPDPMSRPHLSSLRDNSLFKRDFIEIQLFIKHIPLKSKQEKDDFFRSVIPKLIGLPEELVARQLVKPLLSRFVLLDKAATLYMVPHLLTPCRDELRPTFCKKGVITPVLTEQVFKSHVIPEVYKIFHVRDTAIRMVLLDNFGSFADMFDRKCLKSVILPQILLGVADLDDQLVAASLRALADLVLILGSEVVIGGRNKQIFTTGTPKEVNETLKSLKDLKSVSQGLVKQQKILLKDLASGRTTKKNGKLCQVNGGHGEEVQAENRKREKEKRREEAKLKREEKRRQLMEKKMVEKSSRSEMSNRIIKGFSDDDAEIYKKNESVDGNNSPLSEERFPEGEITEEENGVPKRTEDWEGWGGISAGSDTSLINDSDGDGDISDQIETELKKMPSTISPKSSKGQSDSERSSISFERQVSHESIGNSVSDWTRSRNNSDSGWDDWNQKDRLRKHSGSNPLHLSPTHQKQSSVDSASGKTNISPQGSYEKKIKSAGKHKSSQKASAKKLTSPRSTKPLGAEFDIMEIEVRKMASPELREPDFFADMMPEIKLQGTKDPLSPSVPRSLEKGQRSPETKSGLSFAVTEDSTVEAEGWGDEDLSWDWQSTES